MFLAIVLSGCLGLSAFGADIQTYGCTVTELGIPTLGIFPVNSTYANARSVWSVAEYEGRIYIGCGNFDTNAGTAAGNGLPVYAYDPAAGEWEAEYTVAEEQISRFYTEWGALYIPGTDPTVSSYVNIYYKENSSWTTKGNVCLAEHIFDMHFSDDGKTVFAGVDPYTSAAPYIAYSEDGGSSWSKLSFKKDGAVINGASGVYYRTHNVFEYNGDVYATLWVSSEALTENIGLYKYNSDTDTMDYYASTHENLYKNNMTVGYDFTFNGSFVNVYNGLYVFSEDLTSWEEPTGFVGKPVCAQVIGDAVYMSTYSTSDSGTVSYLYKTADLKTFTLLAAVKLPDSYVLSFTYYEGLFYMGTSWGYPESETNGTVFALKVENDGCTHGNQVGHTVKATCTEDGLLTDSCPDCGYLNKTVIESTGHSYPDEWTRIVEPTCSENGIETRICEACGETEGRALEMLGHDFADEYTTDQTLTCTQDGVKSRHCSRCEEVTDVVITSASGHSYEDHICTVCGSPEPYRPGDANGDTLVNILDMTVTARYIAQDGYVGTFDLTECDMDAVDLNADGVIDQLDLNAIAALILSEE